MAIDKNHILGAVCLAAGAILIIVALGPLLLQITVGIMALLLVNYGLKLWGLPPLQLLIPLALSRYRRF